MSSTCIHQACIGIYRDDEYVPATDSTMVYLRIAASALGHAAAIGMVNKDSVNLSMQRSA